MRDIENIHRIKKPEHGSLDWLSKRHRDEAGRVRFGTSEAAAILDRSIYESRGDLIVRKLTEPKQTEETPAMRFGNLMEPILIAEASRDLGIKIDTPEEMFARDRFISTLDGWNEQERIVVEAKTTSRYSVDSLEEIPEQWIWQTVAQRWATRAEKVFIVSLDRRLSIRMFEIPYREDMMNALIQEAVRLGQALDRGEIASHISEMAASHIAKIFPANPDKSVDLPIEAGHLLSMWDDAVMRKKEAEADEDFARDGLARMMLDASVGRLDGRDVVTWKERKGRSSIDTKRLASEMPEIAERFTRIGDPYRVMLNKRREGE
jgi:predicted phage-related endonuclease